MKILALDTSSEACSAALLIDNELISRFEIAPQKHSQLILPMCDSLIKEADINLNQLDIIAFGQGPGSFTGLRIAAGVTQGIAFGSDLPVVGISTLAAISYAILSKTNNSLILACIDARMQEIYFGLYQKTETHSVQLINKEIVTKAENIQNTKAGNYVAVGSGWKEYEDELTDVFKHCNIQATFSDVLPNATDIAMLAKTHLELGKPSLQAEHAQPVYLRNNVAKKPKAFKI